MSTLVLRAAPLLGALAGLVPHTVSRLRDPVDAPGEQDLGVGTARLVLVDGPWGPHLLGLAVARDRVRACATVTAVTETDDDTPGAGVWLARPDLAQLVAALHGCRDGAHVELGLGRRVSLREVGSLWGGRRVQVPSLGEPTEPARADAARMLLPLGGVPLAARASVPLRAADARAFAATAAALGEELRVRCGRPRPTGAALAWGWPPTTGQDDRPRAGSSYLGWSQATPHSVTHQTADDDSVLYQGPFLPWLARAALPDPAADPGGEQGATQLTREVEDYLASTRGLDGPDTTTTTRGGPR